MSTLPNIASEPLSLRTHPGDIAQALTGKRHISFSQINLWRSCPQKYWFTYVTHATPDFIGASLIFGSAIHAALEAYYQAVMEGRELVADDMMQVYRDLWAGQLEQSIPIKYGKDEDEGTLEATASRLLSAFVESPVASFDGAVIALEESVRASLHPELPDVLSRVDLAYQTDDAIVVVDFKTSRCRWNQDKANESADQLMLYRHAAMSLTEDPDARIGTAFVVLVKTKTPSIQRFDVPVSEQRAQRAVRMMLPVWRAIAMGEPYPSPNPIHCGGCPFKSQCPAFTD